MTAINIDPNGPLSYLLEKPAPKVPDNELGKDAFLQLLVAQMKYQNPMEPTDSAQFITQTAQFTLVEQMENMASSNADMLAGQMSATAAAMIGKDVQWNTALGDEPDAPGTGTVQGVRITEDGPILIVDGWEVPLARVTAFGDVPETPTDETEGTDGVEETDVVEETDATDTGDETNTSETSETAPTEGSGDTTPTDESADATEPTTGTDPAPAA